MATQKTLLLPAKGAPFTLVTRPIPTPGPGEVLVKLVATALNPLDYFIQLVGLAIEEFPTVAGCDGAGIVEAVGEGVEGTGRAKGDRRGRAFERLQFTTEYGTFQQYALIKANRTYKIPAALSFEEASTMPLCLATAAIGLYAPHGPRGGAALTGPWLDGGLGKYKDQPVLVLGGSSSVGQFVLQLLKLSGFSPIITTASAHNEAYVRAAGATHVVDYHKTPYAELAGVVAQITSAPFSIVFDAIGFEDTQRAGWALLGPKGTLVTVRDSVVGQVDTELEGGRRVEYVWGVVNVLDREEEGRKWADGMYAGLDVFLADGHLRPNKWQAVEGGLAGVSEAVEKVGKLQVSGAKMVARLDA
ncbi:GroES-like protein [Dentipellis sp. KUC8613]|nr:GroES-like protein [Dentipellis sp. KUC8613]